MYQCQRCKADSTLGRMIKRKFYCFMCYEILKGKRNNQGTLLEPYSKTLTDTQRRGRKQTGVQVLSEGNNKQKGEG